MREVFGTEARGSIYPPIDDSRPVESGIETVASAAKMRLHRDGAQAGIYADEQKPCLVPEQVRQALASERIKGRPTKSHHSIFGLPEAESYDGGVPLPMEAAPRRRDR